MSEAMDRTRESPELMLPWLAGLTWLAVYTLRSALPFEGERLEWLVYVWGAVLTLGMAAVLAAFVYLKARPAAFPIGGLLIYGVLLLLLRERLRLWMLAASAISAAVIYGKTLTDWRAQVWRGPSLRFWVGSHSCASFGGCLRQNGPGRVGSGSPCVRVALHQHYRQRSALGNRAASPRLFAAAPAFRG